MLNRNEQPQTFPISEFKPVETTVHTLKNQTPVIGLHDSQMALIRLDIRLKAGSYFQQKQAVSQAAVKLLTEGTKSLSGEKIAETFDYAGAYIEAVPERDFVTLSIHFPKVSAQTILPIVEKLFTEATFPQDKITVFKNRLTRDLSINLEKTSYLAYTHFIASIFGKHHPYGVSLQLDDIAALQREDIISFYEQYFHGGNMRLFIAGNLDDDLLSLLNNTIGNIPRKEPSVQQAISVKTEKTQRYAEKENAVQSSICIGKRLFNYTHKDWIPMSVLTTVLGGYFGSRLMSNIREDKGLTYGIYARMLSFLQEGLFMIRADVNKENIRQAKEEILKEIEKLLKEPISQGELDLVKNYLSGYLLRTFDGIFSQTDRIILLSDYELEQDYWTHYMKIIHDITPDILHQQATVYLQPDSMTDVVAG
ncbi:MAG: insulinase family protein [Bacteroidales bacterium]|jgi:predicted Zn-dependent peptidase|nr:insulinase family protein [Bacteroidales bacterium]